MICCTGRCLGPFGLNIIDAMVDRDAIVSNGRVKKCQPHTAALASLE